MLTNSEQNLRTFSPSQIRVWEGCPQAWEYNYNEELTKDQASTAFFDFGNYTHELMHAYYNLLQSNIQLKPGDPYVINYMQTRVKNDLSVDNAENAVLVWKRLHSYLVNQSPMIDSGIEILGVEVEIRIRVVTPKGHEVFLHGFIDLVYKDKAGRIRIRDHKTGADPRRHSEKTVMLDDQLIHYCVALTVLGWEVFDVEINFVSSKILKTKEVPLAEQFHLYRYQHTPVGLAIAQANILQKIDLMLDNPTWKNYSPRCPNCKFFDICHLESRGLNTAGVKLNSYKKKVGSDDRLGIELGESSSSETHPKNDTPFSVSIVNL